MSKIKTKRKICVFLGNRAHYSSLRPIMRLIKADPTLELLLFVGASAHLDKYGEVSEYVREDGFEADEIIYMVLEGTTPATMAKSTGIGLMGMADLLVRHRPDLMLVVGDRYEVLSAALAAALGNIPVAHTMGGEISGTIDESIRHAITKMAHIHFPANEQARKNIIRLGENPDYVFNVGCPRMDTIREFMTGRYEREAAAWLAGKEGVGDSLEFSNNFILVSQHPVTTEFGEGEQQINETLAALETVQKKHDSSVVMLWPNADAGSDEIARGIRKWRERNNISKLRLFKNLPLPLYVQLMKRARALVGNSSSGIRDGGFIGTPVVNIGTRQHGRMHGKNVVHADYDRRDIQKAIEKQFAHGRYKPNRIYGNGRASKKIVSIIKRLTVPIQKKLHY